jgi:hypothetical protein
MHHAEPEMHEAEPAMHQAAPEIYSAEAEMHQSEPEVLAEPKFMTIVPAGVAAPEERPEPVTVTPAEPVSETVISLPVAATEPAQAEAAPEANAAPDILDYWDGLRGMRDFPAVNELDRGHISGNWPNTVLLGFKTELPQITRIGENNGDVEYTAMVTSWLMSRGRHAVRRGEAMEEEQKFPVTDGSARYRLLLMPMTSAGGDVCDHVLCHVTRIHDQRGTGFSFKRWLAS